jgi:hypothetical protein
MLAPPGWWHRAYSAQRGALANGSSTARLRKQRALACSRCDNIIAADQRHGNVPMATGDAAGREPLARRRVEPVQVHIAIQQNDVSGQRGQVGSARHR